MGIWKNVRAGAAFMREYQHAAMETLPRWARVVRVGRRAFGMVSVDVEMHRGHDLWNISLKFLCESTQDSHTGEMLGVSATRLSETPAKLHLMQPLR